MISFEKICKKARIELLATESFEFDRFASRLMDRHEVWKHLDPTLNEIVSRKGLMKKRLVRRVKADAHRSLFEDTTDNHIAAARVDFHCSSFDKSESQKKGIVFRKEINSEEFRIVIHSPEVLYKHSNSLYSFNKAGIKYLIAQHLFDRLLERSLKSVDALPDVMLFVLGQLSHRTEILKHYGGDQENRMFIRTDKGAFFGDAISLFIEGKFERAFLLKTFLPLEFLKARHLTPWSKFLLDTNKEEKKPRKYIRLSSGLPFRKTYF